MTVAITTVLLPLTFLLGYYVYKKYIISNIMFTLLSSLLSLVLSFFFLIRNVILKSELLHNDLVILELMLQSGLLYSRYSVVS